jgi:hypothetical protein
MHNVVLALFSPAPPTYTVYSVPMALVIKRLLK